MALRFWRRLYIADPWLRVGTRCISGGEHCVIIDRPNNNTLIATPTDRVFIGKLQYRIHLSFMLAKRTFVRLVVIWGLAPRK